ncbi:hypothetical protein AMTR_s00026p00105230 [Amborella trichopoda]|uniref:Uncharacterized protein n=1 Tax=Amborella trichopoda TaxID=13333 RepID=W1PRM3_AMBTC|nr:hypothetical protein AMTR_s00026p00105230 [Amborella trichopoda]
MTLGLHDPEVPSASLEVWTDFDMRMAWKTCFFSRVIAVKPRLLSRDEDGMKLLSLKKKMRSFFDKLEVIFDWGEGDVAPPQEEELARLHMLGLRAKLVLAHLDGDKESHLRKGDLPSKAMFSIPSHARRARSGARCSLRNPTSRVEIGVTSAASTCVASLARPRTSVFPAQKIEQKEMGALRVRPLGSSMAHSLSLHASGGAVASFPLGPCAVARAMTPPDSGNPVLDVPPLDVVGFHAILQSSSGLSMGTKDLSCEDAMQTSFERRLAVLEQDLTDRPGLVQQLAQERAQFISELDSMPTEVANLFWELVMVKAKMEELQARVASLSACRDSIWEALNQRLRELEQLDSDSAVVTSLANSIAQEISHLQEEK